MPGISYAGRAFGVALTSGQRRRESLWLLIGGISVNRMNIVHTINTKNYINSNGYHGKSTKLRKCPIL